MQASNTRGLLHGSDRLVVMDPVKTSWEKANINAGPRRTISQQFIENLLGFEDEEVFECGPVLSHSSAEDVMTVTGCPQCKVYSNWRPTSQPSLWRSAP